MREVADLHIPFKIWLDERSIPYIYHRPDKKSGLTKGTPDFCVTWCNCCRYIEFKTPKGRLSPDQVKRIDFLQRSGCSVVIARSLEEGCEAARSILTEPGRATDAAASFPDHMREKFKEMKETVANGGPDDDHSFCRECADHDGICPNDGKPCDPRVRISKELLSKNSAPANGKTFLGEYRGVPWVFEGEGVSGTQARLVRRATASDIINLTRD